MLCNNGGAAFSTAGRRAPAGGRGRRDAGTAPCLCAWRTCGVKDALGVACSGCGRDGGVQGIRSLLPPPPPKMWLGQGWRCGGGEGSWGALHPKVWEAKEGLSLSSWAMGCCFPPFHASCLHGVGFSSKEGSGLAGVPEREASVTTRVTADAATLPCFVREAPAPTFLCCVMCFVVFVRP